VVAAFAYLIFFIPLLAAPDSKFAKFHANQGFWLLIINLIGIFILSLVPLLGGLLIYFYRWAIFLAVIYFAYNTYLGKAFELPVFGNIVIFK